MDMDAATIIAELNRREITLFLAGETDIAFAAPRDVQPADVALIRRHKGDLIAYLRGRGQAQLGVRQAREAGRRPCPADVTEATARRSFDVGDARAKLASVTQREHARRQWLPPFGSFPTKNVCGAARRIVFLATEDFFVIHHRRFQHGNAAAATLVAKSSLGRN